MSEVSPARCRLVFQNPPPQSLHWMEPTSLSIPGSHLLFLYRPFYFANLGYNQYFSILKLGWCLSREFWTRNTKIKLSQRIWNLHYELNKCVQLIYTLSNILNRPYKYNGESSECLQIPRTPEDRKKEEQVTQRDRLKLVVAWGMPLLSKKVSSKI